MQYLAGFAAMMDGASAAAPSITRSVVARPVMARVSGDAARLDGANRRGLGTNAEPRSTG
jgi:hypothetical protein